MLLVMYMMMSLPPCSQVCSRTWWWLSYWNSPASPLALVFPQLGQLWLFAAQLEFIFLPSDGSGTFTLLKNCLKVLLDSQAGKGSQLRERNVEYHQSAGTQHISVQKAHCPWLWTELSFFYCSLAFGHPARFFPELRQFVVSLAVVVPLISSPRPRNKVLNQQHWCFRNQFLIMGVRWLSDCRSQPLLSWGSSLSSDFAVLYLDPGERFPWLGEGTVKLLQNGVSDMF